MVVNLNKDIDVDRNMDRDIDVDDRFKNSLNIQTIPIDNTKQYCCYCLVSTVNPSRTYFGSTNDMKRRLRQHNCEISGGAKATHSDGPWKVWYTIQGFGTNHSEALSFEWHCKIGHNTRWLKQHKLPNKVGNIGKLKRLLVTAKAFTTKHNSNLYIKTNDQLVLELFTCVSCPSSQGYAARLVHQTQPNQPLTYLALEYSGE